MKRFEILSGDKLIGESDLEYHDEGMNVFSGRFYPSRVVSPGGKINVVLPAGAGDAQVGRLTNALGSRVRSVSQRAFTSQHFAPGVDMVQYTIEVTP